MRQSYAVIIMLVILLVLVVCGIVWGQERDCPWCAGLHVRVAELESRVTELEKKTILFYTAPNCVPCDRMGKVLDEFETKHPEYRHEKRSAVGAAPYLTFQERRLSGAVSLGTLEQWVGVTP